MENLRRRFKGKILFSLIFIVIFIIVRFLYMEVFYQYTRTMFKFIYYYKNPINDFMFVLGMIVFITIIITSFLYQIILGKISSKFSKYISVIYFISLIYFLFFKTIGITGVNFNILNLATDLIGGEPIILIMNILFFIPMGFLFIFNKKNSIIFLLSIFIIEVLQMVFNVGIFDVVDILLNYVGFIIGTIVLSNSKVRNILFDSSDIDKNINYFNYIWKKIKNLHYVK